ncbi:hypothetical protein M501DRAFT_1014675 [Patellaria atrata CBS 101060]|uniref:Uncharacterized protein n=1 Tax=Patellaria atrata CBS 101060 TaxID=1346257 RepID=A0A9P4SDH0_9PEZI|nr:hypothetical protein M501DRAFT_1014675 [Patellaria atrata CBS 101060]
MAVWIVGHFLCNRYLRFGVLGCMVTFIIEAALVATFVPSDNTAALHAAVTMLLIFQIPYGLFVDGTQFSFWAEVWPSHYARRDWL